MPHKAIYSIYYRNILNLHLVIKDEVGIPPNETLDSINLFGVLVILSFRLPRQKLLIDGTDYFFSCIPARHFYR